MTTTSCGSVWNCTSRGTRVPTEIEKLTLVTGATFCCLITVEILVCCSVVSLAPDGPESRFIGAADDPPFSEGAPPPCCVVEPPPAAPPPSRFMPCAFAKPVPAIRAAAATEIKKRLVIRVSPHVDALPAPSTKEGARCSSRSAVPPGLFDECRVNCRARKRAQAKGRL